MSEISRVQVLVTTLVRPGEYGSEPDITQDIDITPYVFINGINQIKLKTDDSDYDVGFFNFSDLKLKVFNTSGKFNPAGDWRSIFIHSRDQAKVVVNYFDIDGNIKTVFNGLINDEATRQDFVKEEVTFTVLSQDSIFRKVKVSGGTIKDGDLFSAALKSVLNRPAITSVLNYDENKVNVDFDAEIDVAAIFDEKSTRAVLDQLLQASNSVLIIDDTNTMVVRTRRYNSNTPHLLSNGGADIIEAENIISIKKYNTGLHRTFNSILVNESEGSDPIFIGEYGLQQKSFDFDFITDETKAKDIAQNIVDNFKVSKTEMEITTDINIAKDYQLFDHVNIDFATRRKRFADNRMPHYGVAKYGEDIYPYAIGSFSISPNLSFKIIGLSYNLKNFTITLKVREIGTQIGDNVDVSSTRITESGDKRITEDGNIRILE